MNSNAKGKAGEREWARWLTAEGFPARRGQQFKGGNDSPDVICESLPTLHAEVKRVERLNIHEAMDKAKDEAGELTPYVAHRKNNHDWLVTMRAEDWIALQREALT